VRRAYNDQNQKSKSLETYNMSSEELLKPTWCSDDDCSRDPL